MMSEKHLVCQGALCRCSFGTAPDKLKVLTQQKRFINDSSGKEKLIATHMDIGKTFEKNNFGTCSKMNNNPCNAVVTEWLGYYEKIFIEDNKGKALLEDSKATCPIGSAGCITIMNHGQISEISDQNIKNADSTTTNELFPFIDLNLEPKNTHMIDFKIIE